MTVNIPENFSFAFIWVKDLGQVNSMVTDTKVIIAITGEGDHSTLRILLPDPDYDSLPYCDRFLHAEGASHAWGIGTGKSLEEKFALALRFKGEIESFLEGRAWISPGDDLTEYRQFRQNLVDRLAGLGFWRAV